TVAAADNLTVNAAVSVTGTGTVGLYADNPGGGIRGGDGVGAFASNASGSLTTAGGSATIAGATITLGAAINVNTAATSIVLLDPSTAAPTIHLGSNTAFGLSNAELNLITAGVLRLGDLNNTGGISVDGPVSLNSAKVPILSLLTGNAVADNNTTEPDIT